MFVADSADVDVVIGKNVGFGDALGKHSDIHGTLERDDLTVLSTDPEFIEAATKCGVVPFGYNPLNYLYEEDDEEY